MSERLGEFRWEPPHYAWIIFDGIITEEQARHLLQQAVDNSTDLPYLLMVVDISKVDRATPESRRVSAQLMKKLPPRAIALLGGGFTQRIVSKLVLKATEILGGGQQVSAFFRDHATARQWLDSQAKMFEERGHKP